MTAENSDMVDLELYCARIGTRGPLVPSFDILTVLIEHHLAAIPFENIDILLDRGIDISAEAVEAKLIARRRGGYCYEHNGLFKRVLAAIGFEVASLAARVVWMMPEDAKPLPRTHMALRVTLEGEPLLVDVGFGGNVPSSPLRLSETAPQTTRHGPFRVMPRGRIHIVEAQLDGQWQPLYHLSSDPLLDVDFEPLNWFTSTNPGSAFRKNLMVARTTSDARLSLMNRRLTVRQRGGPVERRDLEAVEIERALTDVFRIPIEAAWRPLFQHIVDLG
jgi:N-hydroxyarylamine O-acetyltransferase